MKIDNDRIYLGFLIVIWCCMVWIVNPIGNFPLNDDWAYGKVVETLLTRHEIRYNDWISMPLIVQVLWGSLFSFIFGFSFTVLRFSTIVLGACGICMTFCFLRNRGASRHIAFASALLVAVNPLYFALSNTFMTDIPFFTLALASLYFFDMQLKSGKLGYLIFAIILSTSATLIRQIGISIPLAFAISRRLQNKHNYYGIIAFSFVLAVYTLFQIGILPLFGDSKLMYLKSDILFQTLRSPYLTFYRLLTHSFTALVYSGLFLFPLIGLTWRNRTITQKLYVAFITITTLSILYLGNHIMPLGVNILMKTGIGPLTLLDGDAVNQNSLVLQIIWMILTGIGILGAVLLIFHLVFTYRFEGKLLLIFGILYFLPLSVISPFFDRYLLLLIPIGLGLTASYVEKGKLLWLILPYAIFSIAATHDYLAWNRTRWKALNELKIPIAALDGGLEYNGWTSLIHGQTLLDPEAPEYALTFGPMKGYHVEKTYEYYRYLPPHNDYLYLIKKDAHLNDNGN